VFAVVQPDADDFLRARDARAEDGVLFRDQPRRAFVVESGQVVEERPKRVQSSRSGGDQGHDVGRNVFAAPVAAVLQSGRDVDDAGLRPDSKPVLPISCDRSQFHAVIPLKHLR